MRLELPTPIVVGLVVFGAKLGREDYGPIPCDCDLGGGLNHLDAIINPRTGKPKIKERPKSLTNLPTISVKDNRLNEITLEWKNKR